MNRHPSLSYLLPSLLLVSVSLGCGQTDTDPPIETGTCTRQDGAVAGVEWSLVCGTSLDEYFATATALDDGVLFTLLLGDAGAPAGAATLDLGGGNAEPNFGGGDIVAGAFDSAGAFLWSRQWGDAEPQVSYGAAHLGGGRFAIHGSYRGALTLGGTALPAPASPDADNTFIAVMEGTGEHVAHRIFPVGSDTAHISILHLAAGPGGKMAITGQFREAVDFGGGMVTAEGLYDGFAAVYEDDAALSFAHPLTGVSGDEVGQSADFAESGELWVTGSFSGELDVGDGAPLTGSGPFWAAFAPNGDAISKQGVPGSQGPQYGTAVLSAPDGDTIVGGIFLGTINLGGQDLANLDQEQIEDTNYDLFVARTDPQGGHRWSVRLGDLGDDRLLGVHVDESDQTLVVWGGETSGLRVTSIDAMGQETELFVSPVLGAGSASFAADGSIYVAGDTRDGVDFGAGAVPSAGAIDAWLVRLRP